MFRPAENLQLVESGKSFARWNLSIHELCDRGLERGHPPGAWGMEISTRVDPSAAGLSSLAVEQMLVLCSAEHVVRRQAQTKAVRKE
jgi:hypothetical protein